MARNFPLLIREQSVTVKIYRQRAKTTRDGFAYVVSWIGSEGRDRKTFGALDAAKEFSRTKAELLADGIAQGQNLTRADFVELAEVRRMAIEGGAPPLAAMAEWLKARQLAGAAVIEACTAWGERRMGAIARIKVKAAGEEFIAEKNSAGKEGDRVYRSKLKYATDYFGEIFLDAISAKQWTLFLRQFTDAVTRNDIRKRCVTLCRWAQRNGHLPEDIKPEIEKTERAKERANPIGILKPEVYGKFLRWIRDHHPQHLAAVVLAGLCGVRADEIHGKRADREKRQTWADIHLDRKFMSVSAAKENTPSNRIIHLSGAAIDWLGACTPKTGFVSEPGAMEEVRRLGIAAGFQLPENCFRHSWISYRIALTGDKASTATEAGNSVKEIDRRYRVPLPKFLGKKWFAIRTNDA